MSKRTKSQKSGSLGVRIAQEKIERSKIWIVRDQNEDYGIDFEIEFTEPEVLGKIIKVQVKSRKKVSVNDGFISQSLNKSFLRYVNECRIPIVLIVVNTEKSIARFIWLKKWLIDTQNTSNIYDETNTKTITVKIDDNCLLETGLKSELIAIANWDNFTQLIIALKDLANLSLKLSNDKLSNFLFSYLDDLQGETKDNYLESLIEKIIDLGPSIRGTDHGNTLANLLFTHIREKGDELNSGHVSRLVVRGDSYSRTGLIALGILYDDFPEHTSAMQLPELFEKSGNSILHYYCVIRERYLGVASPGWFNENSDLKVGDLRPDFSKIGTSILDKWANRGDSAILDYLIDESAKS